eukprot:scaffold5978_cov268-Pinguiococcus_pyrenoidosus.AAC.2
MPDRTRGVVVIFVGDAARRSPPSASRSPLSCFPEHLLDLCAVGSRTSGCVRRLSGTSFLPHELSSSAAASRTTSCDTVFQ